MESYDHVGFNNTKFRENPRGSCQKVVEMIWNDPLVEENALAQEIEDWITSTTDTW